MEIDPTLIWKFNKDGTERPVAEQLERRKADLQIALDHVAWYSKNPLTKNSLAREAAHNRRLKHVSDIQSDIRKLENNFNTAHPAKS